MDAGKEMLVQTCHWVKGFPEEVMPESDSVWIGA